MLLLTSPPDTPLAQAIDRQNVRACWLMTTFQNPLGATMPEGKKRELVELLEEERLYVPWANTSGGQLVAISRFGQVRFAP